MTRQWARLLTLLLLAGPADAADIALQSHDAGARLRQTEDRLAAVWTEHEQLQKQSAVADQVRQAAVNTLVPLLPALLRLSRLPPTAVLAAPMPPAQAIRAAMILRATARYTSGRVEALAAAQRAAAAEAATVASTLAQFQHLARVQQAEAAMLDRALEQARAEREAWRDQAELAAAEAARRAAQEAGRTQNMRAAVAAVARSNPASAPGRLAMPVAGPAVRRWGEATEAGPATGMTFRPPPGARIVAPCTGRVVFAGPFRTYGLLLILECGGGLHVVLAGFDRLDTAVGMIVPAQESVGTMAGGPAPKATLYVEVRLHGQAVDPGPFLTPRL